MFAVFQLTGSELPLRSSARKLPPKSSPFAPQLNVNGPVAWSKKVPAAGEQRSPVACRAHPTPEHVTTLYFTDVVAVEAMPNVDGDAARIITLLTCNAVSMTFGATTFTNDPSPRIEKPP